VLVKNNIRGRWLEAMVYDADDIVLIDSAIILHPRVWERQGTSRGSPTRSSTAEPASSASAPTSSRTRNAAASRRSARRDARLRPDRGAQFNLMFETTVGPVEDRHRRRSSGRRRRRASSSTSRTCSSCARRPPFGIAQVGKSFRNEITPGNFLFRVREFEQMEMEYFVPPESRAVVPLLDRRAARLVPEVRAAAVAAARAEHGPEERSHYSQGTSDIEYDYPIGWSELEGVANRGDYDLPGHTEFSGRARVRRAGGPERYVPYVIEPAVSIERIFVAMLVDAYDEEEVAERRGPVLRLHPAIAPGEGGGPALIAKDSAIVEKARGLYEELRGSHGVEYDEGGASGRRYRAPGRDRHALSAFTVDEQTLADDTVTIRDRDSLGQERLAIGSRWPRRGSGTSCARPWATPKASSA
jgi:glycyl-tRNA synthetase